MFLETLEMPQSLIVIDMQRPICISNYNIVINLEFTDREGSIFVNITDLFAIPLDDVFFGNVEGLLALGDEVHGKVFVVLVWGESVLDGLLFVEGVD